MAQIREIKKRMVAVGTIQRITKTMQMIATAKFTAAVQRAKATKPYSETVSRLVGEVAGAAGDLEHPLIDGPSESPKRELLLVISSDRGLCGAYNANVLRKAMQHVRSTKGANLAIDVETVGKKAIGVFKFAGIELKERHILGDAPSYEVVEEIASRFMKEFTDGTYDAVRVAYMRFETNSRQIPELRQLLPLQPEVVEGAGADEGSGSNANYEFSPSSDGILADLLPLSVKSMLFQAFNDAGVSEQIMRMVAMKAATENARDLKRTLSRDFNRARQAQITTELSEIIAGSAALE